jgi:hypothetical protein
LGSIKGFWDGLELQKSDFVDPDLKLRRSGVSGYSLPHFGSGSATGSWSRFGLSRKKNLCEPTLIAATLYCLKMLNIVLLG